MAAARPFALPLVALLIALIAVLLAPAAAAPRARRQLADDAALQPLDDAAEDEQTREKRKLEGVTQAKFGIKNAVLGFVFGKINSLIDAKTRFVDTLDRKNIELNKQYGIEPPAPGGLASLSGVVTQVIGPKLQLLGPKLQAVTGLLGGLSGGSSAQEWQPVAPPGRPAHLVPQPPRHRPGRRHPDVRPEQGQPGLPGEFVWAIRVPPDQNY
ncbi:uncharacterized protein LOC106715527 isoform X1 [Papilio machaon]|uniref:uncharacterized protein LOC106715527 isoform X1 n=1 Tax=Papilio machaon TaxID=76193 RepID=UPI001E665650|nr:uncharacterized protein LOC106715527 isoform X1 [Papilio machaon]